MTSALVELRHHLLGVARGPEAEVDGRTDRSHDHARDRDRDDELDQAHAGLTSASADLHARVDPDRRFKIVRVCDPPRPDVDTACSWMRCRPAPAVPGVQGAPPNVTPFAGDVLLLQESTPVIVVWKFVQFPAGSLNGGYCAGVAHSTNGADAAAPRSCAGSRRRVTIFRCVSAVMIDVPIAATIAVIATPRMMRRGQHLGQREARFRIAATSGGCVTGRCTWLKMPYIAETSAMATKPTIRPMMTMMAARTAR